MSVRRWTLFLSLGISLSCLALPASAERQSLETFLGQPLELRFVDVPESEQDTLVELTRQRLDELAEALGSGRDTELSRLNRGETLASPSRVLLELLAACEGWREYTGNTVSCRLGEIHQRWQQAERDDRLPDRVALRDLARALDQHPWPQSSPMQLDNALSVMPGNLMAGFVLDQVWEELAPTLSDSGAMAVTLAGVQRYSGNWPLPVTLAEDLNGTQHGELRGAGRALAVIDANEDDRVIDRRRFTQWVDPRDGWAVTRQPQVWVLSESALTAQVLASALAVLSIREGLALIERHPTTEALVVTRESGTHFSSGHWYSLIVPDEVHPALWRDDRQFLLSYEIPEHRVSDYRRPYVAVWITDAQRQPVRQLLLHGQQLRWLREVPLWWRRHGRRDEALIDGIARPTPPVGEHMLVWDGRNDQGQKVGPGDYQLHIEAVREYGDRELLTMDFTLDGETFEHQARGKAELGRVHLSLKPR